MRGRLGVDLILLPNPSSDVHLDSLSCNVTHAPAPKLLLTPSNPSLNPSCFYNASYPYEEATIILLNGQEINLLPVKRIP